MTTHFKSTKLSLFLLLVWISFALALVEEPATYVRHQREALARPHYHEKRQNTSSVDLSAAQKLVAEAVVKQGEYNAYRFANPRRNTYKSKDSQASRKRAADEVTAPKFNASVIAAAALLAEHDAALQHANGTLHKIYPQPKTLPRFDDVASNQKRDNGPYWVAGISHTGHAPMGGDSSYLVYRDVTNTMFAGGAKGDGKTDDTAAINAAIAYGSNCGSGCESSSVKGTLIYFPPGTYLISTPIEAYYYSQLVGDPNNLPIIKTSAQFIGLGAIESDVYIPNGNGGEWYVEQSNFFRQVRNLAIDIRATTTYQASALHWQVAQATSLTNVYIYASTTAGNSQRAIFTENGSGGFMSNCFISGGQYGLYGGNQQYTVTNFEFSTQTEVSIVLLWDWGWTWSRLTIAGSPVGFMLLNPDDSTAAPAGSVYIMDSLFDGVATAIKCNAIGKSILDTSIIILDNIAILNVNNMIAFTDNFNLELPAANTNFVVIGNSQLGTYHYGYYDVGVQDPPPSLLGHDLFNYRFAYFVKERPQYETLGTGSIISVKDHGALGNGVNDDTAAIVAALALGTTSNLIYFPAGSYIVTSTIVIPPHVRITGEVWSQLVASGSHFANMASPKVMIQVGSPGDVGTVEISDILFTSIGALPGLVMVEWNVQAESPGSVGMWDTHFRVGGAAGTNLQVSQCPKSSTIQTGCIGAALMLHITPSSNGYFENVWAWVADHDIDDPTNTMVTVAVARGMLIESNSGPTWLYGTASEHSMLYQYNFYDTANTFAGMIQTESPYFQYSTVSESPGPFGTSVGLFSNDPIFPDGTCSGTDLSCNISWAVIIEAVTNLTIAGAGLYSWFDNYDQSVCVDAQNCQQRLINDAGSNSGLYIWNLITIGATEMISNTLNGETIYAANNTQSTGHPYWSALAGYLEDYTPGSQDCDEDDTDPLCQVAIECDKSLTFTTLDQLQAAAATLPNICMDYYALGVLQATLSTAVANYTLVNKGYDQVFSDYAGYVKDMVPDGLSTFMADPTYQNPAGGAGNKYFQCTLTIPKKATVTQQCPFPYGALSEFTWNMKYTLTNSTGFYAELASTYSIAQSWVTFGHSGGKASICSGRGGSCLQTDKTRDGYPLAASSFTVPNPKDIIAGALPNITILQANMFYSDLYLASDSWVGPSDDILQTYSMPVLMITSALDAMAAAKAIGQKIDKAKKLAKILEILGIVFIFIPFLDDITPELGILDGVFNIISVAGNVGLSIQAIIADPTSAPMEILGDITGGTGLRSEDDFARVGSARRGISTDDLKKISTSFATSDAKFQGVVKHQCKL